MFQSAREILWLPINTTQSHLKIGLRTHRSSLKLKTSLIYPFSLKLDSWWNSQEGCCPAEGLPVSPPVLGSSVSLWALPASRPALSHICHQGPKDTHHPQSHTHGILLKL